MNTIRPYVNLINLDEIRELSWCHDAMAEAMDCYRHITGEPVEFEVLAQNRRTPEACKAFVYGALTTHTPISLAEFWKLYQDEKHDEYLLAVLDGIANYWLEGKPEPVWDELDLQYPVIEPEMEAGEFYFPAIQYELVRGGFSLAEIGQMTMRGTLAALNIIRGVVIGHG